MSGWRRGRRTENTYASAGGGREFDPGQARRRAGSIRCRLTGDRVKKLYRFVEDRKIAGVCAGLGDYFDLDPVFFRLFFLVSLLFGGLGAIVYLLLWIMVPEGPAGQGEPRPPTRLHLSRSDRKIAGVCGGLGEWLEIDPVFFRVAFVLLALVCGLGILVYLVLWLVLPRAPARAAASG